MKKLIVALSLLISIGAYSQCKFVVADDVLLYASEVVLEQTETGDCKLVYLSSIWLKPMENSTRSTWQTNTCGNGVTLGWSYRKSGYNWALFTPISSVLPPSFVKAPIKPIWFNNAQTSAENSLPESTLYLNTTIYIDWTRQGQPRVTYGKRPKDFNRYLSDGSRNPNYRVTK